MGTILLILGFTAAVVVFIQVLSERYEKLSKWRWKLSISAASIGVVLAIISFFVRNKTEEIITKEIIHQVTEQ
jgi:mannose/fructose/N-acetylgalactosamine-specific phosphotransferase system component IIC